RQLNSFFAPQLNESMLKPASHDNSHTKSKQEAEQRQIEGIYNVSFHNNFFIWLRLIPYSNNSSSKV
ncbi:MAG TPA: hypothetical protein PK410_04705, partial [Paludibacteraceae bacterium]|nr:hypothetical protein [Paludibacteraceae bacterium]